MECKFNALTLIWHNLLGNAGTRNMVDQYPNPDPERPSFTEFWKRSKKQETSRNITFIPSGPFGELSSGSGMSLVCEHILNFPSHDTDIYYFSSFLVIFSFCEPFFIFHSGYQQSNFIVSSCLLVPVALVQQGVTVMSSSRRDRRSPCWSAVEMRH